MAMVKARLGSVRWHPHVCGVCLSSGDTYTPTIVKRRKKFSRIELTYSQYVQSIAHECIILPSLHMFKHISICIQYTQTHIEDNWNSISFAILCLAECPLQKHTGRLQQQQRNMRIEKDKKKINKFIIIVIFFCSLYISMLAAFLYANFTSHIHYELRFTFPYEFHWEKRKKHFVSFCARSNIILARRESFSPSTPFARQWIHE